MNLDTLHIVVTMAEEPFRAHLLILVAHRMTMRGAPPSWWAPTMLLSVFMPHTGRDEEAYIEALEQCGRRPSRPLTVLKCTACTNLSVRVGEEDVITSEKKIRFLNDDTCEYHTWQALGCRVCKKQTRLHFGTERKSLYDLVPEQGFVPGTSFPSVFKSRGGT